MIPTRLLTGLLVLTTCLGTLSCAHATSPAVTPTTVPPPTTTQLRDTHERLNGLLWVQTSAEYHVLAAATYRDAWQRVQNLLDQAKAGKALPSAMIEQPGQNSNKLPLAVIVDIDETVFDNSPMSGKLVTQRMGYATNVWDDWVALEQADFIVGAEQFITNARGAGLEVFFVTNRTEVEEAHTIDDLKPLVVTDEQILASKEIGTGETVPWESEKGPRRAYLARTHWVIAMVGDDLADFVPGIRKMKPADRVTEAMKHIDRLNSQWFLLPNPLYGSWETVLYNLADPDDKQLTDKISKVKSY